MNRIIRGARPTDMAEIMQVMNAAKKIMRQSGNMHQWGDGYPSEAVILADMERDGGFVIEDDSKVVGYFAFLQSPEPTYAKIYDGDWMDDAQPYHVVHRIASYPDAHGIFNSIMEFCFSHDANIRIDTHRDNIIMQHNILKHGFTYCGIIYLLSGDERLAYQKARSIRRNTMKYIAYIFVFVALLLCSCRNNKADVAQISDVQTEDTLRTITEDMAYEGVNNYCHKEYDWSAAKDNPDIMYVQMGEETDSTYQVIFRSYTGAFVHFYVNKTSGKTKMVEKVPSLNVEEEAGTIDLYDYLEEQK